MNIHTLKTFLRHLMMLQFSVSLGWSRLTWNISTHIWPLLLGKGLQMYPITMVSSLNCLPQLTHRCWGDPGLDWDLKLLRKYCVMLPLLSSLVLWLKSVTLALSDHKTCPTHRWVNTARNVIFVPLRDPFNNHIFDTLEAFCRLWLLLLITIKKRSEESQQKS